MNIPPYLNRNFVYFALFIILYFIIKKVRSLMKINRKTNEASVENDEDDEDDEEEDTDEDDEDLGEACKECGEEKRMDEYILFDNCEVWVCKSCIDKAYPREKEIIEKEVVRKEMSDVEIGEDYFEKEY